MPTKDFRATIDNWVKESEARMLAVFRESAQRTVSLAQSRIQVDTGFARASVRASLQDMPQIDPAASNKSGAAVAYDGSEIVTTIANAGLGETIYVGWTANYVGFLNYGTSKMAGSHFVDLAVMEWPRTVSVVVAEAKQRVNSRD